MLQLQLLHHHNPYNYYHYHHCSHYSKFTNLKTFLISPFYAMITDNFQCRVIIYHSPQVCLSRTSFVGLFVPHPLPATSFSFPVPSCSPRYMFLSFSTVFFVTSHLIKLSRLFFSTSCQAIKAYTTNRTEGYSTTLNSSMHKTLLFVASDNIGKEEESCAVSCCFV